MLDLIAEPEAPRPAAHRGLLVAIARAGDAEQAARAHRGAVVDRVR